MFAPGEIISYLQMCNMEKVMLQRGMNYHLHGTTNVILMSQRPDAPYDDNVSEDGKTLIYEGHDRPRKKGVKYPKKLDQPYRTISGGSTQNKYFFDAAIAHSKELKRAEIVRVYEKIRSVIWVFNGHFQLVDAWIQNTGVRNVFKFKLELQDFVQKQEEIDHNRIIPSWVKQEVWKRDKGKCVICGSTENLHFDHIIPYINGGSSKTPDNIQILCAKHNLRKSAKIE